YGYAGLGFSHFNISNYNANAQALSSFRSSDDVMNIPVGACFAYAYKSFIADARAGWTGTINNDLLKVAENTNTTATLNHWSVGGQVGLMFQEATLRSAREAITRAAHREEVHGAIGIRLQLRPQLRDEV